MTGEIVIQDDMNNMLPPKPANAVLGIVVDGKPTSVGPPTLRDAEQYAQRLVEWGRRVELFDKVTDKILKRLS
ncbi:MAG: hypothetical protein KGJ79_12625 [Alphaproteobacteria bacterium]|nr:hypothetical protein [Alphaproteobacteria bacterium]MDE2111981.1 hypothetical protein [Alphaproteobacteria bacterium]MDE2492545.1 hypothetical protein [Alphaproteobacteria bacterium]